MAAAVAVFVKTAARSAVKTRLAATVGADRARAVYEESLRLLRRQLVSVAAANIAVHWAVAEADAVADTCWQDFPAVWTGEGTLGDRLHQIYQRLRRTHQRVILIGADCPQLTAAAIVQAAAAEQTIIGPTHDGGFYLFAGSCAITRQQWLAPRYSSSKTLAMLLTALADDTITFLPTLTDIDDSISLEQCLNEFPDARQTRTLRRLAATANLSI